MDRLELDQVRVEEFRTELQASYPDHGDPLPGSTLKIDDDVLWLGFAPMRVVWGHDHPQFFNGYCPDIFGDLVVNVDGTYIDDRAPADPNETPMPIYPQQQQQQQQQRQGGAGGGARPHDRKKAFQNVLKQLKPDDAKRVRELVRAQAPDLLESDGGGGKGKG